MEMYFHQQDLNRLRELNEEQLYLLNEELSMGCSLVKSNIMLGEQVACKLVALAQTAAKEVACRNCWSPKPSNGQYSTNGITYDTEEYRQWMRGKSRTIPYNLADSMDVLSQFSFCDVFLSLTRA